MYIYIYIYTYIYTLLIKMKDEVLVVLDRDQVHFGISGYEENEIDLNLVIIIRVGFQVQV